MHDLQREGETLDTHNPSVLPLRKISAERLILSAGTFGTTFLLLKNLGSFPHVSPTLGTHFSGNGDFVAFAMKCSDGSHRTRLPRVIDAAYGPAITSTIRIPDRLDNDGSTKRGFYVQDAGYPNFINWMLQMVDIPGSLGEWFQVGAQLFGQLLKGDTDTDIGGYAARLFGSCELSAGLLPMGGMGRDYPTGMMRLRHGKLNVDQDDRLSDKYYGMVRGQMIAISKALGAEFKDDPLWNLNRFVTVHPLGGCPLGRNSSEGVVNEFGEVFNYPGLYIADGSVMAGPVGPNPSLTIAALADRFADGIIAAHSRKKMSPFSSLGRVAIGDKIEVSEAGYFQRRDNDEPAKGEVKA
jgi:cholesterol oxidase